MLELPRMVTIPVEGFGNTSIVSCCGDEIATTAPFGVSVISAVAVRAELRARTLTARTLAPPLARHLAIVRRRDKPPTPALDAVLAALEGVASS